MEAYRLEMLKQIAGALAAQFGPNCEVVVHDLSAQNTEHPIVHIENGHVTGRRIGDGPSKIVMEYILSLIHISKENFARNSRFAISTNNIRRA